LIAPDPPVPYDSNYNADEDKNLAPRFEIHSENIPKGGDFYEF